MTGALESAENRSLEYLEEVDARREEARRAEERREARKYFPYTDQLPGQRIGQLVDRVDGVDRAPVNTPIVASSGAAKGKDKAA